VLQVPAVHVIELFEVLVFAGNPTDGHNPVAANPQKNHIANLRLRGKSPDIASVEIGIVSFWSPPTGIARADKRKSVFDE
jgi:hypothetical protein